MKDILKNIAGNALYSELTGALVLGCTLSYGAWHKYGNIEAASIFFRIVSGHGCLLGFAAHNFYAYPVMNLSLLASAAINGGLAACCYKTLSAKILSATEEDIKNGCEESPLFKYALPITSVGYGVAVASALCLAAQSISRSKET